MVTFARHKVILTEGARPIVIIAVTALLLAITAFIIYKLSQGKNWARIVLLIFVAITLLFYVRQFVHWHALVLVAEQSPVSYVLGILEFLLQVAAVWLVFVSSGRLWFKAQRA